MITNPRKVLIVLLGILVLAAVWIAVLKPSVDFKKILSFFKGREKVERVAPSIFDNRPNYLTLIASVRQRKSPSAYSSFGRRDPMVPLVESRKVKLRTHVGGRRPPKLSLEGIIWSKDEPEAVINGIILKENDFIRGIKVLQINRDSVILIYQSRKLVLRLE